MKKFYPLFLLLSFGLSLIGYSQHATIKGKITNGKNKETLPGVNVIISPTNGVTSDADGNYELVVEPGRITVTFSFIGFSSVERTYDIKSGEVITDNVVMKEESLIIEGVVISAGKFEQKLSDITVSMEVLKPQMIESLNANEVTEVLRKIPGLEISDGQPSIRGGSGYSYGAGSRVLLLVDDLPILTPDAGDAKWNFIPIENISQIEVIKGASSALFGSSALTGIINVRTAFPKDKPLTKIVVNSGIYMNPAREETIWWSDDKHSFDGLNFPQLLGLNTLIPMNQPNFSGITFLHSQKFGQFDLVIGANGFLNNSYRESENEKHGRININLRYRDKKIKGLSYGINANYMYSKTTNFFLWQDADSGALRQNPDAISKNQGRRLNIDPYVIYFDKREGKHSIRTRYFSVTNQFKEDPAKNNNADMVYAEYQYHKKIKNKFDLTTGILGSYGESKAELFGSHFSINASAYLQLDFRFWKKLGVSVGARAEYYRIDTAETASTYAVYFTKDTLTLPIWPVFRIGLNYQLFKYTFLRASFGQGYRFPTIAEKFVKASVGGLNLFPNPQLKPETGWTAEVGVKQGVKLGNWNGYIDLAGFWTEYSNMMEFTFGIYKSDTATYSGLEDFIKKFVGFKSVNVGHARITGFDVTLTGQGNFFGFPATLLIGCTYTNPIDLVDDSTYKANKSTDSPVLKYRNYFNVKGDFEVSFGRFNVGISYAYISKMINIDRTFEERIIPEMSASPYILPGLKEYREKHNKGSHILDLRVGYTPSENTKISLLVKNITNTEYMSRPGYIEAPRNIAFQYSLSF
jgi:outer membrane cobalamin receptor